MKSADLLIERWTKTLERKSNSPAIFRPDRQPLRTFREIDQNAQLLSKKFDRLNRGDVLAVQIGNDPDWPSILLACAAREAVVLPLETTISKSEREAALNVCQASALLTAEGLEDRETAPIDWGDRLPVLLKLTSGTTAAPRAVRFRAEQLLADCDNICETMGIDGEDINFGVIPVSHSYGFSNLLTPLLARGVAMVMSRDRLPRAVLDDLEHSRATVFPGMPVFFQAFGAMGNRPPLEHLRLCISAGAPLTAAVAKDFQEKFGQPIHSFYGSSECGGICYDRDGTNFEDGFVGAPMDHVEIEFLEPAADASQIRVRSSAVADGYFPEAEEGKLSDGVFIPDDLLAPVTQGEACFKITGRISDVINVAGKKVNPAEVEAQLLAFAGVKQAIVFGRKSERRNEEVAACVVATSSVSEADLLKFCREHLSGWQVPKRIFLVEQIPANERGKTSRRDLAARFAE